MTLAALLQGEDPFCVDYSQYNDEEDKADTSVDQSQLMIGLALMACATDLEGQRIADHFFGEGLWDASYLMLVTCTFAAHGISTTMVRCCGVFSNVCSKLCAEGTVFETCLV